jgi:hypothetical protein
VKLQTSNRKAMDAGQYAAANATLITKAKLSGRWPAERTEQHNTNKNYVISDEPLSEEEWTDQYVTSH